MVEDVLDDGVRIARLLSSEVTGHEDPPLGDLAVTNVNEDVEAEATGARAYDVVFESVEDADAANETPIASVLVYENQGGLQIHTDSEAALEAAESRNLAVADPDTNGAAADSVEIVVPNGAAVKRAIDVLAAAIREK